MKICENCGKEHNGSYGSGRFCCKECARSFSTKNDKKELKEAKCVDCGKIIYINKRASIKKCRCEDCYKKNNYNDNRIIICPICGTKHKIKTKCPNKFCNKHNFQQFNTLIKYFGFNKEKLKTLEVEKEFLRIREILYNLYWNKHLNSTEIAKLYNYPSPCNITGKIFKYLEIPNKKVSEANSENVLLNKINFSENYKTKKEWHTTWDGKEVYLRSSYEIDYANKLDEQQIKYDVECLRIKYFNTNLNEYHCAVPDFYLLDTNTIVEIKSTWTLDIQEIKDKVKAYKDLGYNFKLILEHNDQTNLII